MKKPISDKQYKKMKKFLPGPRDKIRVQMTWVPQGSKRYPQPKGRLQFVWLVDTDIGGKVFSMMSSSNQITSEPMVVPFDDGANEIPNAT